MNTIQELIDFVQANEIHLLSPGMVEWQDEGCYTAYKNFKNPNGCVMEEDENPVKALVLLHKELTKKPDGQEKA